MWVWAGAQLNDFPIPGLSRERLPADYVTGISFAVNVVGLQMISHRFSAVLLPFRHLVRWFASRTFTLYLLHLPLIKFLSTFLPWGPAAAMTQLLTLAVTVLAVLLVAEFSELRKESWHRFFVSAVSIAQQVSPRLDLSRAVFNRAIVISAASPRVEKPISRR